MNTPQIFSNDEFGEIRTLIINGEPWFVGKDVASILGYQKPLNALAVHIDEDDSLKWGLIDNVGRNQETILINESGLYSLILTSKLPTAKKFKHWVTSEVLPQLRKNGTYAITTTDALDIKERIQIARLIAFTPRNRLSAVKEILSPVLGGVELEQPFSTTLLTDSQNVFEAVEELMSDENAVLKICNDGTYVLDRELFRKIMKKSGISFEDALKVLDETGHIKRGHKKRTCPVSINGNTIRCIVYRP